MFPKTQAKTDRPWDRGHWDRVPHPSRLCHDLTVPATSIKLLTQVAAAESDPGPSMRARLRQISDEAARIADICGYFLDQPGSGPADLDLLAAEVADSARWRIAG